MNKPPKIHSSTIIAKTQIFCVESLQLEFSNGATRTYERLKAGSRGAVMIVPLNNNGELLLVREWAAGTERYELAFPKGLMEKDETPIQAANRELQEEVGFSAHQFSRLKSLTLAPGYLTHRMHLILAQDLFPKQLLGDEPEPMEIVPWPMDRLDELLEQDDFTEARSVAALFLVNTFLKKNLSSESRASL